MQSVAIRNGSVTFPVGKVAVPKTSNAGYVWCQGPRSWPCLVEVFVMKADVSGNSQRSNPFSDLKTACNLQVGEKMKRATPCFTPGTVITTARGDCPVEALKPDDLVITRDNGMRPVVWIGKTQMFLHDFQADPHLLPVLIRKGVLGNGVPERDMLVSPNHRMLVVNPKLATALAGSETLVAAKHLGVSGRQRLQASGTTYIHFMCETHEVVLADGAWTESFQPDDQSLRGIGNAQRLEIMELFPDLKTPAGLEAYQPARPVSGG